MSSNYLVMCLEGYSQAWGITGKFSLRTTDQYPTKSGVVGILAACLGVDRGDVKEIGRLASMQMRVYKPSEVFDPVLGRMKKVRTTVGRDYHTIGGNDRQKVPKANGATAKTVITERDYLYGACFVVIFEGEETLIQKCAAALLNPVWPPFLGRKCCIPSRPMFSGVFDTPEKLLEHIKMLIPDNTPYMEDGAGEAGAETITRNDVPVNMAKRRFSSRLVSVWPSVKGALS